MALFLFETRLQGTMVVVFVKSGPRHPSPVQVQPNPVQVKSGQVQVKSVQVQSSPVQSGFSRCKMADDLRGNEKQDPLYPLLEI